VVLSVKVVWRIAVLFIGFESIMEHGEDGQLRSQARAMATGDHLQPNGTDMRQHNGLAGTSNAGAGSPPSSHLGSRSAGSPAPVGGPAHFGVQLQPDPANQPAEGNAPSREVERIAQYLANMSMTNVGGATAPQPADRQMSAQLSGSPEAGNGGSEMWNSQAPGSWGNLQNVNKGTARRGSQVELVNSPLSMGHLRSTQPTYLSDSVLADVNSNMSDEESLLSQFANNKGSIHSLSGVGAFNMVQRNPDPNQMPSLLQLQQQQQQQLQQQSLLLQQLAAGRTQQVRLAQHQAQQQQAQQAQQAHQAQALAIATSLLMGQGSDAGGGGAPSSGLDPSSASSAAFLAANNASTPGVTGGSASLYVKNLPPEADELLLYRTFSPLGALLSCKVHTDPATGRCRGVGFVNFADQASAVRALQQLHGTRIADGRVMHITLQAPRAVRAAAAAANAVTGMAGAVRPMLSAATNNSQLAAMLAAAGPGIESNPSGWSGGSGGLNMSASQAMLALAGAAAKRQSGGIGTGHPHSFSGLPANHMGHGGFMSDVISPRAPGMDAPPSNGQLGNMGMVFL